MSSNSIYIPYFYIIQDVRNGMYYAGSKYGKDANPANFMTENGYQTTSNIIKELIETYGLATFIVRKIRIFETGKEAYDYEKRFLIRVDARNNPRFYNKHNNDHIFTYQDSRYKEKMFEIYGVGHPMYAEELKIKLRETNLGKYGFENTFQVPDFIEKGKQSKFKKYGDMNYNNRERSLETKLERYGNENYNNREKAKNTWIEKYGVDHPLKNQEIKKRQVETNLEKYGVEYYTQTDDYKDKYERTCMERYGVSNAFKSEIIKQKIKDTNLEKYGVDNYTKTNEYKIKTKSTKLKRYGNENYNNIEKAKRTKLERYGNENYRDEDKRKETCKKLYGVEHYPQSDMFKENIKIILKNKAQRKVVKSIKLYVKHFGVKLRKGWYQKDDEYLNNILNILIEQYGDIT